MKYINFTNVVFLILLIGKVANLGSVKYSYFQLLLAYVSIAIIMQVIKWLSNPETARKVAAKMYVRKNKIELKKAEKKAQKIVKDAGQTK